MPALGQSHRIRCPPGIRPPSELAKQSQSRGPGGLPTPPRLPFLFSQLTAGTATPLLQNSANPVKAQMLLDVDAIRGWEKAGANYKARGIRTKPRGHHGLVTLMARISSAVIKKKKNLNCWSPRPQGKQKDKSGVDFKQSRNIRDVSTRVCA